MKKNRCFQLAFQLALQLALQVALFSWYPFSVFGKEAAPLSLAVSDRGFTVVVLPGKINEVNIGSAAYVAKVKAHYLLLKSSKKDAAPTSLFVTYNNCQQFLHATVAYAQKPPATYDLRTPLMLADTTLTDEDKSPEDKWASRQMQKRIASLELLPQQYKDVGVRRDGLTAIVTHIVADKDYFYLRLFISNEASAAFAVEEVSFMYVSGAQERVDATPIVAPGEPVVLARSHQNWVYVLPSYALKRKDKLEINLWESKGARSLKLVIPSSILLTSRYEAS